MHDCKYIDIASCYLIDYINEISCCYMTDVLACECIVVTYDMESIHMYVHAHVCNPMNKLEFPPPPKLM